MKKEYRFRTIDRAVFYSLAVVHVLSGVYLISPAYLHVTPDGPAPLYVLFESDTAVRIYGVALVLSGIALAYAAGRKVQSSWVVVWSLFAGFLLRLYSLIGTALTIESWRPPSYLSHAGMVFILGAYWVWVRRYERTS